MDLFPSFLGHKHFQFRSMVLFAYPNLAQYNLPYCDGVISFACAVDCRRWLLIVAAIAASNAKICECQIFRVISRVMSRVQHPLLIDWCQFRLFVCYSPTPCRLHAGCLPAISVYITLVILPLADRTRMQSIEWREAFPIRFQPDPTDLTVVTASNAKANAKNCDGCQRRDL